MKYDKYKITKGRNIVAKYNKNLYSYALEAAGGKISFSGFTLFLKYVSYTYMIAILTIVVIGFSVVYNVESADATSTFKLAELRTYIIWLSFVLAFSVAGLIFSIIKKYLLEFPFAITAAFLNIIITMGLFTETKQYLFRHFFPSFLVLIFITYFFIKEVSHRKKIKRIYEDLSNKLYRSAVAKKSDGIVSSAEHEKLMDEYKGGPIKIEYKK